MQACRSGSALVRTWGLGCLSNPSWARSLAAPDTSRPRSPKRDLGRGHGPGQRLDEIPPYVTRHCWIAAQFCSILFTNALSVAPVTLPNHAGAYLRSIPALCTVFHCTAPRCDSPRQPTAHSLSTDLTVRGPAWPVCRSAQSFSIRALSNPDRDDSTTDHGRGLALGFRRVAYRTSGRLNFTVLPFIFWPAAQNPPSSRPPANSRASNSGPGPG